MTRVCHASGYHSLTKEVCAGRATHLCLEEDDLAVPNDEARRCRHSPQTKASSSYQPRWGVSTCKRWDQLDRTRCSVVTRGGNVECHMSGMARCSTKSSIATSLRTTPSTLMEHNSLLSTARSWNTVPAKLDCPAEGWQLLPNMVTESAGLIQSRAESSSEARPEAICSAQEDLLNAAEAHEARSRITGAICFAVPYPKVKYIAKDVPVLRIANGRIFVEKVDRAGLAWNYGVRPGDELVRIKVGSAAPFAPDASACALQRLAAEPSLATQPAVSYFMGFKGDLQAEVQVARLPEAEPEPCPESLRSLTGNSVFQVQDCATIRPNRGSVLIASKVPAEKPKRRSNRPVPPPAMLQPDKDGTWRLLEVERQQARLLLESAKKAANAARIMPCIVSFV